MRKLAFAFCAFLCGIGTAAAGTDAYLDLADQLYGSGLKGVKRLAVLPFAAVESSGTSRDTEVLAGRIYTALAERKKFKIIDGAKTAAALSGAVFIHEKGLENGLGARLDDKLDADGVVTGLISDIGDNRLEIDARIIRTEDSTVARTARVIVVRDWAGAAQARQESPDINPELRQEMRALARKGVKPADMEQWGKLSSLRLGSLAVRTRIAELGDREKQPREEINAWRAFPDETAAKAYLPCSAADCTGLKVSGGGYYRAYYSDGFTLKVDNAGSVLDFYYPPEQLRRIAMRARSLELRPQAMRGSAGWDDFMKGLNSEPRYGKGATPNAAVLGEIAKWAAAGERSEAVSMPCTLAQDYCKRTGIMSQDYLRVSFQDGFTLIMDGAKVANCYYKPAATDK